MDILVDRIRLILLFQLCLCLIRVNPSGTFPAGRTSGPLPDRLPAKALWQPIYPSYEIDQMYLFPISGHFGFIAPFVDVPGRAGLVRRQTFIQALG